MCVRADKCGLWIVFAAAVLLTGAAAAQVPQRVTSEDVQAAVRKGVAFLRQQQGPDGAWPEVGRRGGTTALALLALLNAGVPADDPAVVKGLLYLDGVPLESTYTVSLQCQVYAAADPRRYAKRLREAAQWLAAAQNPGGMWTYVQQPGGQGGDNSNTQFALLGLHEAHLAKTPVPGKVWRLGRAHFLKAQNADGGWGYTGAGEGSWGSMTAAGVASLFICGQRLLMSGERVFRNGAYPDCGMYSRDKALTKGIEWLARNFNARTNPNRGTWQLYWLYGVERVGMISGLRALGPHDWYRAGAAELVDRQNPTGYWNAGGGPIVDTSFALLFLAKGNRPVIIQKVQWPGRWNRNIHDLENLTAFMGDKLGQKTTWQSTDLSLPLSTLRTSPILFITGHEFPAFTPQERQTLRRFVDEAGGTLLFEACCGRKEFADGFRAFAKETWPDRPLRPLEKDHPVYSTVFPLEDTYGLEGIDAGCRTGVFFSPKALSCLWELRTIPKFSQQAFEIGTNLAAYATGGDRLRNKLDVVELPPAQASPTGPRQAEIPRGAIRIARLVHGGQYDVNPGAEAVLSELLREQAGVDVVPAARHVRATDKAIYEYPVVFMTGLYAFELSDEEIKALRRYLDRGGFLMVNNGCGRDAFRESFHKMVQKLFPDNPLRPLPKDHPIYTGQTGVTLGEVLYRPYLAKLLGARGTTHPPLEAVDLNGRTALLYSRYDYGCALEGVQPYASKGYLQDSGRRLAMAIFLYAISY